MAYGQEAVSGDALVKFRDGVTVDDRLFLEWQVVADESEAVGSRGLRRIHSAWYDTETLVAFLASRPEVEFVEPNYVLRLEATPNDTFFSSLWGLLNTGTSGGNAGADIGATTAWNTSTGSRAHVVGVVDTGIDYLHPDLAANVWSAPWAFNVTIGGVTITCAAGTHGFNAINNTCNPMDDNNHGTHASGTIGAVGNNNAGVVGVNWATSLMGLKFLGANGSGTTANAINAIEFAIQAKAAFAAYGGANVRVLSNSWGGGGYSQALLDEINKAHANGMLFVAAAGNDASNNDTVATYPANYNAPNVLSVAATTNQDGLASFSNYGHNTVHIGAPGVGIFSTTRNGGYGYMSGTSMATPHVAGAAALLLSACPLSTATLKSTLLNNGEAAGALTNITTTGFRLNLAKAMQACIGGAISNVALTPNRTAPQPTGTTITWTATPTGGVAPYQYRWLTYNGTAWTVVGQWTTSNTFAWTPTQASGSSSVAVWVRSAPNTAEVSERTVSAQFAITSPVSNVTLGANRTAPLPAGTTITWTATPTGGVAPHQYRWLTYDGTTWVFANDWSTSNTFAWTPMTASPNAAVTVWVRSAGNTANAAEKAVATGFAITAATATVTTVAMTANRTAPQPVGSTITWTATPTGGTAPHQYRWLTYDGTTWTFANDWSASNTFAWTPSTASANAAVTVWVRSAGNSANAAEKALATGFAIAAPTPVSAVALSANRTAPQPLGTTITWTATPTGGVAPHQYRWLTFDGSVWTFANTWGSSNTFAWTPSQHSGSAAVTVWVRSAGNSANSPESAVATPFAITPASTATGLSLVANRTAPQPRGTVITWTATPTGGTAPYQYRWLTYDGTTWVFATDWGSSNTFAWTPSQASGSAAVGVWVRSAGNTANAPEQTVSRPFAIQ